MHPYFGRTELLIGEDGLRRLQAARVALFGLGGVGSFAAEALARSGVGYLRLVDFDIVGPSNFNRQLYALHSTAGQAKVAVATARLRDINPEMSIDGREAFFHANNAEELLAAPLDFVIDAIDSLGPKCELLAQCATRGLPVISAMGAAARTDPFALRLGTVWDSEGCPLARKVRQNLRKRGIDAGSRRSIPSNRHGQLSTRGIRRRRGRILSARPPPPRSPQHGHAARHRRADGGKLCGAAINRRCTGGNRIIRVMLSSRGSVGAGSLVLPISLNPAPTPTLPRCGRGGGNGQP